MLLMKKMKRGKYEKNVEDLKNLRQSWKRTSDLEQH